MEHMAEIFIWTTNLFWFSFFVSLALQTELGGFSLHPKMLFLNQKKSFHFKMYLDVDR